MSKYWGYHLHIDLAGCEAGSFTRENIASFLLTLVPAINMKAFGDPVIKHFAGHNPDAAGFSCMQLIETSSITGHFVDASLEAYIDIFSCTTIDQGAAMEVVKRYFGFKAVHCDMLFRKAPQVSY